MKCKIYLIAILALGISSFCPAFGSEIIDLGSLYTIGGNVSPGLSINESRKVAGTTRISSNQVAGFIWDNGTVNLITSPPFSYSIHAVDINNSDTVIYEDSSGVFSWQNGSISQMGQMTGAGGINDLGNAAGFFMPARSLFIQAAVWKNNTLIEIEKLHSSDSYNIAADINNSNQVIGTSGNNAFIWEDGQLDDLGVLDGDNYASARAINNDGNVVGYSRNAAGQKHAFLWQDGALTPLNSGSSADSWAQGINDNDVIVGGSSTADGTHAYLWQNGLATDLNTLALSQPGWILKEAHDINSSGWIVGYGTNPSGQENHGFLLQYVPEPGGLFFLALGGLLLRKRQKSK